MKIIIRWRPLALFGLALLGLALRLYGINWDQGNSFHPDERQILFHVMGLSWPNSVAQFFDPVNSPLNPHFFAYGSFPLYLLALVGSIVARFSPELGTMANLTLIGRAISAIFDSGTILLTGWLGLMLAGDDTPGRKRGWALALLAAALVTFTPLQLQLSHFYAVDTQLLFFVVLTILACVALANTDRPIRWSLVAGLGYGLALATKFSAAPLAVPLIIALAMRWYKYGSYSALISFLLTASATWIVVLIAMPYALLDMPSFVQQLNEQGDLARGLFDLPYVRQFAGTTPYVYEAQNMLLWGMGVMLGLAAFAGLLWLLWRVWKRKAGSWLIVLSWVVIYGAITGDFYVKYMRYMLPLYPFLTLMAAALLLAFIYRKRGEDAGSHKILLAVIPYVAILLVLGGTMFQGLALLNVYSSPNTRVQASLWIYNHVKPGSVLTYEQWDDPLPVIVDNHVPNIYAEATYPDAHGQPQTGLDLYGDDTTDKARQLAKLLPGVDVITMATDRLDKSIPRLPFRYPLTIHYYQLLFSGQLGFHLAAQFENRPNLLGIKLDDSNADESYSVFDHPTARIFVRDNPYPYTSDQLYHLLIEGVQLPPPGASLSGNQHSLMLTPQQIADDQQSPPFSTQFPANSFANAAPIFFWWFTILILGLLTYPLAFLAFRALSDRGYIFSKTLALLLLAYAAWLLASLHVIAFSHLLLLLVVAALLLCSAALLIWQRQSIYLFLRQKWRLLLLEEILFTLAFLLFVAVRSLNPDLWHIYLGGEKPMELVFLNAVLRSPYMPPYDPWFAGGYINYYYYGYVIFGAFIKLTGIIPSTAFNLAIPTLFALTFTSAVSLVYTFTHRFSVALLGGYFAALIGNLNGLVQLKGQFAAVLAHVQPPAFDYWQSSRIIPYTINEFPFWSFLFADLHPHVIDLPLVVLMLGIAATFILPADKESVTSGELPVEGSAFVKGILPRAILAAFVFGTIACVNPWDMPVCALLLAVVLIVQTIYEKRQAAPFEMFVSLGFCLAMFVLLCGLGYLFYLPFYSFYQQLYVNGLGLVKQGTMPGDYLTIFGLWLFLAIGFFLLELYRWWSSRDKRGMVVGTRRVAAYLLLCGLALMVITLPGLKALLAALIILGAFLFLMNGGAQFIAPKLAHKSSAPGFDPATNGSGRINYTPTYDATLLFTFLLLLLGLCITLGQEVVYVRDFLDGSDYYRMNSVFKFSMQAWVCFAIGGALVVHRLWNTLSGFIRRIWSVSLVVLVLGCSIFLLEGTVSRIHDHQLWINIQPPARNATYTPTLDGFAFARAWYPGDAGAIAWLNDHVAGSPVMLEAAAPASYQWFNRVSVYTGLPDVLGWPDHVGEQRYDYQQANRVADITIMYTTSDIGLAVELLRYYHVRYIYIGALERQLYGQQSPAGLKKFDAMVGSSLRISYRSSGVTIYELL